MEIFMPNTQQTPWTKPPQASSKDPSTPQNSPEVRLHESEPLYVLRHGDGFSCLGFKNARDHAHQISSLLARPGLALRADEFGTLAGYARYREAIDAWSRSHLTRTTYFDPGTAPEVTHVLERCRTSHDRVRLVLGDTDTGQSWFDEYDVVGTIHRSGGHLKVPLLIADRQDGGPAILTTCLLCIIRWKNGKVLYRHPVYQHPELELKHRPEEDRDLPWLVIHQEKPLARFAAQGKAAAYLAFMQGECVEPRVFQ
jgi:hypothetical protein